MENKSLPEFIMDYVRKDFNAKHVDKVVNDIIDVMTGNRAGNNFEIKYCDIIMKAYNKQEREVKHEV